MRKNPVFSLAPQLPLSYRTNLPFHTGQQTQTVVEPLLVCLLGTVEEHTYTHPTLSNDQTVMKTHPMTLDWAGKGMVIETSRTLEKNEAQGREEGKPDRKSELDPKVIYPLFQKVTVEIHGPVGMTNHKCYPIYCQPGLENIGGQDLETRFYEVPFVSTT